MPIIVCLLVLFPFTAKAQYGFDVASIEAYINDHKQQRSLLLVRSTLEASNKLLHEYSSDANIGFRDINKELDRYTRAFDVIDILYQSLRTVIGKFFLFYKAQPNQYSKSSVDNTLFKEKEDCLLRTTCQFGDGCNNFAEKSLQNHK